MKIHDGKIEPLHSRQRCVTHEEAMQYLKYLKSKDEPQISGRTLLRNAALLEVFLVITSFIMAIPIAVMILI